MENKINNQQLTSKLEKMRLSIDPKFVELTADVLKICVCIIVGR